MNRLFWACVLFGLCAVGCSKTSNSDGQTVNKLVATTSPTATASPTATTTPATKTDGAGGAANQTDVTGAYFPASRLPVEFSEIEHLSLATIDDQGNPAPLNGFIRPKNRSAKDYRLVDPKLDGKNLTFSTTTVGGIGYRFKGTLEKLENFSANPPPTDEVVLTGTLTKLSDDEEVALTKVSFTYSAGG